MNHDEFSLDDRSWWLESGMTQSRRSFSSPCFCRLVRAWIGHSHIFCLASSPFWTFLHSFRLKISGESFLLKYKKFEHVKSKQTKKEQGLVFFISELGRKPWKISKVFFFFIKIFIKILFRSLQLYIADSRRFYRNFPWSTFPNILNPKHCSVRARFLWFSGMTWVA